MNYDPRLSHFDLDLKRGVQGELFVYNIREMFGKGAGSIEVKTDYRFLETRRFYIEYACCGRDGKWRRSGLVTSKATFWAFVFGEWPGMFIVDTEWVRRAASLAWRNPEYRVACEYGGNPTQGVVVTIEHFILTKQATA
jgi:hypothetical protein